MRIDEHADGTTCWIDIGATDVDAVAEFYAELLGWSLTEGAPETGGYRRASIAGGEVAGIGEKMSPEQPTAWMPYIKTSDIDATLAKATQLGATVVAGPMSVMDFGSLAIFIDPVGAALGLWQPGSMRGMGVVDEPGAWTWTELMSGDVNASAAFYGELFGWRLDESGVTTTGDDMPYLQMALDGRAVAGIMGRPPMMPDDVPNYWSIYFAVADLTAALEVVAKRGGSVVVGPMEIAPGNFAQFFDPFGAMVGLLQLRA